MAGQSADLDEEDVREENEDADSLDNNDAAFEDKDTTVHGVDEDGGEGNSMGGHGVEGDDEDHSIHDISDELFSDEWSNDDRYRQYILFCTCWIQN